jgi:hypothetical protein
MSGYIGTSSTLLSVNTGAMSFTTQSTLSFLPGESVSLVYALNDAVNMQGTIVAYNPITGAMIVNITVISGIFSLQPPFNTQPWGSTSGLYSPWNISLVGTPAATSTPVIPTIIVRTLNVATWDPQRGQGLSNFLTDTAAVAQILNSRIRLFEGEWWQNTSDGTPVFQSLLGHSTTSSAVALILRERILGTPFVTDVSGFSVAFGPGGRTFSFTASVLTAFGSTITVSTQV